MEFFDKEELLNYMNKEGIDHLSGVEGVGFLGLTNHGGLTILINQSGDGLFYQMYNQSIEETPIEQLKNEASGELEAGFYTDNGFGYLLSEFIRRNY